MDAHEIDCGFPDELCSCFDGMRGTTIASSVTLSANQVKLCADCQTIKDLHYNVLVIAGGK